jgi:cell division protein FtsI/penicillin-binding protein 2
MRKKGESLPGVAQQLETILGADGDRMLQRLVDRQDSSYVVLQQWLDSEQAPAVRDANIKGLVLEPTYRRNYPRGRLASHILGFRNQFHTPLAGIEYHYQLLLDGKPSAVASVTDGAGGPALGQEDSSLPAVAGCDLVLTLDAALQDYVDARTDALWDHEEPKAAHVVVLEPSTGAILAMASRPDFNPQVAVKGPDATPEERAALNYAHTHNYAVESDYEPGSTLKVLLAAAALENDLDPARQFDCKGTFEVKGGDPIRCWGKYEKRGHGKVDLEHMVAWSCNVAAAQVALTLKPDYYIDFLRMAGLGTPPRAGFPAETAGQMPSPSKVGKRDLAAMGFGQSITASPLQLAAAAAAIANEGERAQPHILASVVRKDGSLFAEPSLPEPARLCSKTTADAVLSMMHAAVEYGTAGTAKIEGVSVAAKTGTAQKWDKERHRYVEDKYLTSFLLICPTDQPRFVIYVSVDEPTVGRHGSDAAGPTARDIASFAMRQVAE